MSPRTDSLRGLLRSGAGIAVAIVMMNVATYAFQILAAHVLGPRDYGALASLMGLLLVVNVLALGLQATGARQVAAQPDRRDEIARSVMAATYRSAATLGVCCLVLVPVIHGALSIDSWAASAMIGISVVPLTVIGGQAGILQGEERWVPLAVIFVSMGIGRIAFGAILLPLMPTAFGAMLSVALGAAVPAAVGAVALGPVATAIGQHGSGQGANRILREVLGNSSALLAFFALSNLDVIVARVRFDAHEAGLYAGGLILTKAVLFLPQFVVVIVFPAMASSSATHRMYLRGLAAVAAIGLAATAGAAVLSDLAVVFVGGNAYEGVRPNIWLFATLGTLLALVQLMVYEVVARQHRASALIIWLGLAAVVAAAPFVDSGAELVRTVAVIDLAVLLTLVLTAAVHPRMRTPVTAPDA